MSLLRLGCKKTVFSLFTALRLSLSFRSPAAKVDFKGMLPMQSQSILVLEGSMLGLMLYSDHLKILDKFWTRESAFATCTGPHTSVGPARGHVVRILKQPCRRPYGEDTKPASKQEWTRKLSQQPQKSLEMNASLTATLWETLSQTYGRFGVIFKKKVICYYMGAILFFFLTNFVFTSNEVLTLVDTSLKSFVIYGSPSTFFP